MNTFVTFKIEDAMKTFRYILFVWVMLGCGLFASCEDDEVEYAPLAVTRVSTVLDREQGIDQANLAQYIIVQGTGLNAVNSILVNDVQVDLKDAYITSGEITFPIPRVIPGEINNLITLGSGNSTVTAPISVFIPELEVNGMFNEFTPAGDTMKVVGDYFDLYEITTESGQLFFGGKEVKITKSTGNSLSFVLPEDAVMGSKIKLVRPVCGEVTVPGKYMEKGNMLCDFDPFTGWGGSKYVIDGPVPAPYSGYFSRFKINKGDANDWDWNEVTTIAQCAVEYSPEVIADQNKYLLKFEVNTIKPLTKRQIRFYFSQINYDWEPFASGLALNTNGEWKTVSIDLGEMWKGDIPNDGVLQIMGNSWAEDTDICFDNFRIVPKD